MFQVADKVLNTELVQSVNLTNTPLQSESVRILTRTSDKYDKISPKTRPVTSNPKVSAFLNSL